MAEVLASTEGLEPGATEEDTIKARDRVLAGQSRLRKALFQAVDALEQAGSSADSTPAGCLCEDEPMLVRQFIDRMLYRRSKTENK